MADGARAGGFTIYYGRDLHAIDPKGRVNIPARHRRVASRKGSVEFWLSPGFEGCVFLWDAQGFMDYASRIASLSSNVEETRRFSRNVFPRAARVEPDDQGRVVIPKHVRSEAGLGSQVLVLGVQDHLELWNPRTHEAYEKGTDTSLAEIASRPAGEDLRRVLQAG
jgi:MraZ protein